MSSNEGIKSDERRSLDGLNAAAGVTVTYPRKHPLRWVMAVLCLAVMAGVIVALAQAKIVWPNVLVYTFTVPFLQAVWSTIVLAVVSQVLAIAIGVVVAIMRISHNPVASSIASFYIWIFRGVPVLVQILMWYNLALVSDKITLGIPGTDVVFYSASTNAVMTPFVAALLGLALNEAAYMAEIIRGGIKSVDSGQVEAATALAMSPGRTMRRIVLPQAMRVIIPPTGNDFINMLKTTSLASVITYPELLRAAQDISSRNLEIMETLFACAFWYMVVVSVTSVGQYFLEKSFDASLARPGKTSKKTLVSSIVRLPMRRVN
ncbi:amino acid ABC transporter permease [Paenarthrobacter sp. NPDC089675]|uniref:amino acid ABC transporter permease n=1 Tax=Paenarthrobacter TaxID=1742992 RepID=UPI003829D916